MWIVGASVAAWSVLFVAAIAYETRREARAHAQRTQQLLQGIATATAEIGIAPLTDPDTPIWRGEMRGAAASIWFRPIPGSVMIMISAGALGLGVGLRPKTKDGERFSCVLHLPVSSHYETEIQIDLQTGELAVDNVYAELQHFSPIARATPLALLALLARHFDPLWRPSVGDKGLSLFFVPKETPELSLAEASRVGLVHAWRSLERLVHDGLDRGLLVAYDEELNQ